MCKGRSRNNLLATLISSPYWLLRPVCAHPFNRYVYWADTSLLLAVLLMSVCPFFPGWLLSGRQAHWQSDCCGGPAVALASGWFRYLLVYVYGQFGQWRMMGGQSSGRLLGKISCSNKKRYRNQQEPSVVVVSGFDAVL